jgi:putative chitobiose transport system substrate-binding protein
MKRFACILTMAVALGILAVACGGDATTGLTKDGRKIIVFRTMQLRPTFDDYFLPLFAEYEAANPDVKIQWDDLPYPGYNTKLMTGFLAGKAPDVINLSSESVLVYADEGRFWSLDELLPQEVFDTYVPSLMEEGGTFNGKPYALPWYASTIVTFANAALLREAGLPADAPPLYYEDLRGIAEAVRQKTDAFGIFPIYTEAGILRTYLEEGGQPLFDEAGNVAFNTERGVRILDFWTSFYRDGLAPSESLTATHRRPIELYKAGKLAVMTTGPQFIAQVRSDAPDVFANTLVGPQLRWKDARVHFVALHTLSISKTSKHPKEAAEFAAFVTNARNQLAFCKRVTIIPSVTEALNDPYFLEADDTIEGRARLYSAEQARLGRVFQPPPELNRLDRVMEATMEAVAQGRVEPARALAEAQEKWNEILRR